MSTEVPTTPTAGAQASDGTRRRHPILVTLGVVLLGVAGFVGAAVLADQLTDRSDEAVPRTPVSIEVPSAVEAGASDPGAEVTVAEPGPAMEGIPGGEFVLPPHLVEGTGPGTNEGGVGAPPPIVAVKEAPALADELATASLTPPPAFTSFVDNCTTGATPCPIGVAATVKSSPYAAPTAIHLKLWPGITKALYPALRCDPGYATSESYPVVVTVDEPITIASLKLSLGDGLVLDEINLPGKDTEKSWHEQQVASGKKPGTDLGDSQHYCASLRTEGDPGNAGKLQGKVLATPITYRISGKVIALEGGATAPATVDVTAPVIGPRPPTVVKPLTGHVAQVVIAERDGGPQAQVWLVPIEQWGQWGADPGDYGKTCATPPSGTELASTVPIHSYNPALLAQKSYPYDAKYTHFSVRDLVLEEAKRYKLCVAWTTPKGVEREETAIETPDGFVFEASVDALRLEVTDRKPFAKEWIIVAFPPSSCHYSWSSEPLRPDLAEYYWKGSGGLLCDGRGLPWPPFTTFHMQKYISVPSASSESPNLDMGSDWVASPTWCWMWSTCPSGLGGLVRWELTLEWRVPCIGAGCGSEGVRASVPVEVRSTEGNSNGRRDPLDWRIQGPPKLYSPGQGGSSGGGFPEPGP